MFEFCLSALHS